MSALAASPVLTPVIALGRDGRLAYDLDAQSNRVPDFSSCGYAGGDRPIPLVPVRVVVTAQVGDETAVIQQAIDYVGALPVDAAGLRGAVLLAKGRHEVWGRLQITNSGVVLRGEGAGADGSVLVAMGTERETLIRIHLGPTSLPSVVAQDAPVVNHPIVGDYVPVGATRFQVQNSEGLKVGAVVNIVRPCTKAWIDRLGATEFGGGEGDWRLTWSPESRKLTWMRVVKAIEGNAVTVDAPITTALEKSLGGGFLVADTSVRLTEVGVENLWLESAWDLAQPKDENHAWCAITMNEVADAWVRQVSFHHFAGSAVALYEDCRRVTVEDCNSLQPVSEIGGYRRHTFFTMGQQTLFIRCHAEQGRHDFAAGYAAAGPNAFVQCEADEALGDSGAIESWASGTLFDNVRIDGQGLNLMYRGANPAGAGWSAANSVLWNCSASQISAANPPGAQNWAFGCWGEFAGNGVWRNSNGFMRPASLYLAQLADRRGADVAAVVPFMERGSKESSNPDADEAVELTAASQQPARQLKDFIAEAAVRNPLATPTTGAKPAAEIFHPTPAVQQVEHKLVLTNGWLVCDGRLMLGGIQEVAWWRGNIRPSEAGNALALTRFVPGRAGLGFTDDLNTVADRMMAAGKTILDHHYGLWYDRRRDDHERTRRSNGDVWPPFFEQPFARSGQGAAWDGLSRYDLTRFNPWYWARLNEFAGLCDERGLVLFNENYFQHNIIEAGAHWVDCPWRPANNINDTAFPEPPPFAGDKRIFMAEQFYDETNPARRALHERFIRQNLDNFTNRANVIQFTSAEFTGPTHFVAFWLDTIAQWRREHVDQKPIIALAAPKNVQDAILADPARAATVDVIALRYWWITGKGVFAPEGGKSLAPRQFQRQWKGGNPSDENLAAMTAECRAKYAGKAVIAASEQGFDLSRGAWAYVCAGGSLPNLPRSTDANLLAAIPQMQPWPQASMGNCRVLREAGRQVLIYTGGNAEMDLTGEAGSFRVHSVDPHSGIVTAGDMVTAGGKVALPKASVVWLTKE
jgi:hypothetical protein